MTANYVPTRPIGSVPANPGGITIVTGTIGTPVRIKTRLVPVYGTTETPTNTNSVLKFVLRDQRFGAAVLFEANWDSGIAKVDEKGLICVTIPTEVTTGLRRGSYDFSLLVSPLISDASEIVMTGHLLLEYETTSPHRSIPYKD